MRLVVPLTVTRQCDTCAGHGWHHHCRFGDGCPCGHRVLCDDCDGGTYQVELTVVGSARTASTTVLWCDLNGHEWPGELTPGETHAARTALRDAWRARMAVRLKSQRAQAAAMRAARRERGAAA